MNENGATSNALERTDQNDEAAFLCEYKKKEYPKPSLTVDIAVFRLVNGEYEILLVRRGNHPFKGSWALPGGFVDPSEDVPDAARRELFEETGLENVPIELFGVYGAPGRDPRGWTVSAGFCAFVEDSADAQAGDDAADARWCALCAIPAARTQQEDVLTQASASGGSAELKVMCGEDEPLFVRYEIIPGAFRASRAHVTEAGGFAFDHAQLLADAYLQVVESGC
ncbi:NUDIX hydrolase [Slackia heliotrinireducens]|uniref:NUDIX hydrolase n=1 Tax=Slackia heliotrinireducens TaxID=84110 RepID=UPI003314D2B8